MTQDEIIEMARQAGFEIGSVTNAIYAPTSCEFELKVFAKLVAAKERDRIIAKNSPEIERCNAHIKMLEDAVSAERDRWMQLFLDPENQPTQFGTATQEYREQEIKAEREACAKVADDCRYEHHISLTSMPPQNGTAVGIANRIRARGEA